MTGALLAAALAGLSACTAYNEVFGDEPVPGIVTTGTGAEQDAVVPNLASVPSRPETSTATQRQALQQSLREDRSQAVYSNQPAQTTSSTTGSTMAAAPMSTGSAGMAATPQPPSSRAQSSIQSQTRTAAAPAPAPMPRTLPGTPAATPPQGSAVPAGTAPSAVGPGQIAQYNMPQRPKYSELVGVIFFGYGSSGLDGHDVEVLRQIVQLQKQRGGRLRVVGHASMKTGVTDPVKHNLANFNVSLKRAQHVASRLEALGAPGVVVGAVGAAQPVYYEFMPTGEAGNRRAEIFLDY
ncbi:OmpA family protein [Tistlia consotensis]|nr:OmpA family protein [Tistlia consotensis]